MEKRGRKSTAKEPSSSKGGGGAFIIEMQKRERGNIGIEELLAAAWIRCRDVEGEDE